MEQTDKRIALEKLRRDLVGLCQSYRLRIEGAESTIAECKYKLRIRSERIAEIDLQLSQIKEEEKR